MEGDAGHTTVNHHLGSPNSPLCYPHLALPNPRNAAGQQATARSRHHPPEDDVATPKINGDNAQRIRAELNANGTAAPTRFRELAENFSLVEVSHALDDLLNGLRDGDRPQAALNLKFALNAYIDLCACVKTLGHPQHQPQSPARPRLIHPDPGVIPTTNRVRLTAVASEVPGLV